MKRLLKYIRPYIGMMSIGFGIKVVGSLMDLVLPWILSMLVDEIIPAGEVKPIVFWGIIMVICSLCGVTFNILANRMAARVAGNTTLSLRHDLFSHIMYLDAAQVDEVGISSLESRLTVDTYNVHQMVGMIQRLGIRAPILFVGGIAVSFALDVRLTLVMICTLPFIAAAIYIISKKCVPLYTALQQAVDRMTGVVRENASGVRIIKALGKSEYEKKRFDEVNRDAIEKEKTAGITMSLTNPLVTLFLNLGLTGVIVFGAFLVNIGLSKVGKIIAFMSYFTIISNALISLSRMFTISSKAIAGMNRIDKVLSIQPKLWVDGECASESGNAKSISFKNVTFAYDKSAAANTLENISFDLSPGQTLGIIGATGSGKSTIISLLLRIYDTDSGEILIDGVNVKDIPSRDLRSSIGIVFQNDFIFADTIEENIKFGRNVSTEDFDLAIENAQAAEYINSYDDREKHEIDIKGANLSGGQRQRLLISRALAGNPNILILDDSSSALDYKTDAALRHAIAENMKKTTTIIIAQRISSIAHADKIIMLDAGKCIGYGSHDDLIANCPQYAEIHEMQMGGGITIE